MAVQPVSYTHLDVYKRQDEGWHCIYPPSSGLFLLVTNKVSIGIGVEIRIHGSLVITTFNGNTGQDGPVTDVFAELKLADK